MSEKKEGGVVALSSFRDPDRHRLLVGPRGVVVPFDFRRKELKSLEKGSRELFGGFEQPPKELTDQVSRLEDRLNEIGLTEFQMMILPEVDLRSRSAFWGKNVLKPDAKFGTISNGMGSACGFYPENITRLDRGIYLIDSRLRPDIDSGRQQYGHDDFMENVMLDLRRRGDVGAMNGQMWRSRFGATISEIEKKVLPEVAKRIGHEFLEGGVVRNTRFIEFIAARSLGASEMREGNAREFYGLEVVDATYKRNFGYVDGQGEFLYPNTIDLNERSADIAFRPIIEFRY